MWAILLGVVYSTDANTQLHTIVQYLSVVSVYMLAFAILIVAFLRLGLFEFIKTNRTSIELEMQRTAHNNNSVSSRTAIFRRRNSSLPSLPGEEEPEYHTISNVRTHQDQYNTHLIQVHSQEIINEPLDSVSENDGEVEKIFYKEDEPMEENATYGVTMPPLAMENNGTYGVTMPPLVMEDNGTYEEAMPPSAIPYPTLMVDTDEFEFQDTDIDEDSQWFKQTACSPLHQPFSPASSVTFTPTPSRIPTIEEENEIDRLYQRTRAGNPTNNSTGNMSGGGHYAEIRPIVDQSPSYSMSVHTMPWYHAPESENNYSNSVQPIVPSSLETYDDEEVIPQSIPSPPSSPVPPLPPRLEGSIELLPPICQRYYYK